MQVNVNTGQTLKLNLSVTNDNIGISGESPTIEIKRDSDDYYWDGSAFVVSYTSESMSATDEDNWSGLYEYDFTFPVAIENYFVHYKNTGTYTMDAYDYYVTTSGTDSDAITNLETNVLEISAMVVDIDTATAGLSGDVMRGTDNVGNITATIISGDVVVSGATIKDIDMRDDYTYIAYKDENDEMKIMSIPFVQNGVVASGVDQ